MSDEWRANPVLPRTKALSATADRPTVTRKPPSDLTIALVAWKRISVKLQLIADAPAGQALDTRPATRPPHHGDSRIPQGVRLTGNHTAPSKQFSLYAHYSYRVDRAMERNDAAEVLKLAACATRDYEIHMRLRPAFHEKHEAAVTELLRDCTGVPAIEASWWLGAPEKWVRRQRVLHGRDAEFGEKAEQDERTRKVVELKRAGKTVRQIAEMTDLPTTRVQRIVNGEAAA